MEDDIDYSELNDVELKSCVGVDEFGYSQYVLENELGKLEVKGSSRVFTLKRSVDYGCTNS